MQRDMHYFGTYSLARAAGIDPAHCQAIASAAEFVDDCAGKVTLKFEDGGRLDLEATAHHTIDADNVDPEDQRQVWVPFHFLPGCVGQDYTEKLICVTDSEPAKAMLKRNLDQHETSYYLQLVGISAHVYMDTFSHYGFSGVSSRRNRIVNDSFKFDESLEPDLADYIKGKAAQFFRKYGDQGGLFANIKSTFAEVASGALGHGAVATYPDRPYLKWSFEYEYPDARRVDRPNPDTYLAGCRALHATFKALLQIKPELAKDNGKEWDVIEERIRSILGFQGAMENRETRWKKAAEDGDLFAAKEPILDYLGPQWLNELHRLDGTASIAAALEAGGFRFCQAAADHRTFVLRRLLPERGVIVD